MKLIQQVGLQESYPCLFWEINENLNEKLSSALNHVVQGYWNPIKGSTLISIIKVLINVPIYTESLVVQPRLSHNPF
jgi:hypothetical protein